MRRIDQALARRIDRLAGGAHAFHRFAHHPLCDAYRSEILRIGHLRVCRGCSLAGLGGGLGSLAGCLLPRMPLQPLFLLLALGIAGTLALIALPRVRSLGKWITRLLPVALFGFLLVQGLRRVDGPGFCLAGSVLASLGIAHALYRRRGPWRRPCRTCPEREASPCAGFQLQMRRERAFQRLAGRMLAKASVDLPAGAGLDDFSSE